MLSVIKWYYYRLSAMSISEILLVRLFRPMRDFLMPPVTNAPPNLSLEIPNNLKVDYSDFNKLFPNKKYTIISQAEKVVENTLTIFGQDINLNPKVSWNIDYITKETWPTIQSKKINYRKANFGDPKNVWELNRFPFLLVLGKAWQITKNPRYSSKAVELIDSWITQCPPHKGINWVSCIELSIRQLSWVWSILLIRDSEEFTKSFAKRLAASLYIHTSYIEKHLSLYSSANNHLMSELCALVVIGRILNIDRWVKRGSMLLEEYLPLQIMDDGSGAEQSPSYLSHSLEFFLLAKIMDDSDFTNDQSIMLNKSAKFLNNLMGNSGMLGEFGDNDSGTVLPIGTDYIDRRSLINIVGYLLNIDDLTQPGYISDDKIYWLFGYKKFKNWKNNTTYQKLNHDSFSYKSGGYYGFNNVWNEHDIRLIFDCGPLGLKPLAGHGHMDALSFVLEYDSIPIFVDPGTYTYFGDDKWRDYFRSGRAHSTITVDGEDQSIPRGPFMYSFQAETSCIRYDAGVEVIGKHEGYQRLRDPVSHIRKISIKQNECCLNICDNIKCSSSHNATIYFQINYICGIDKVTENIFVITYNNRQIIEVILDPKASWKIVKGSQDNKLGWFSKVYNQRTPSPCIVGEAIVNNNFGEINTTIRII